MKSKFFRSWRKNSINAKKVNKLENTVFSRHSHFPSPVRVAGCEAGAALAARVTGEATGQAPAHQCNATNFETKTRSLERAGVAVMAGAHTGVWPHQLAVTYRGWVLRVARVAAF